MLPHEGRVYQDLLAEEGEILEQMRGVTLQTPQWHRLIADLRDIERRTATLLRRIGWQLTPYPKEQDGPSQADSGSG